MEVSIIGAFKWLRHRLKRKLHLETGVQTSFRPQEWNSVKGISSASNTVQLRSVK